MNISLFKRVAICITLALPCILIAQDEFSISGVVRPRFEFRDGYGTLKKADDTPAAFVNQRTRLTFNYGNEKIESKVTLYDYRVWGDQVWKKDVASVGVHEAWAKVKFNENAALTLGRQCIQYDNGRLFSAVNWNQVGAAHDVLRFSYKKNDFDLDVLTAWNQNKEYKTGSDYIYDGNDGNLYYKNLNVLWLNKKFENFQIAYLTLVDGFEEVLTGDSGVVNNPDVLHYRYTTGLIFKQKGTLSTSAQAFYQGGKLYTGQKVSSYYINLEADYAFNKQTKMQLGIEILSGNDFSDSTNTTNNAFDILYGARHKFNGTMDYFSIPSTTAQAGLINPYLSIDHKFENSLSASLDYHLFYLQKGFLPGNPQLELDKYLGQEIDIKVTKKFNDYMSLMAGYSVMFASETMETLKGGDRNKFHNWAFVMFTVNPTFFAKKND